MNLKNLIIRSLSGAVYVALIVLGIITTQWAFVCLCSLLAFLATREFLLMTKPDGSKMHLWVDVCSITILVGLLSMILMKLMETPSIVLSVIVIFLYLIFRPIMQLYNAKENPVKSLAYSLMPLIYIMLPMVAMMAVYMYSPEILLLLFVMIWMNDTGAFLVGCTMGKHRLFERISPKKSWEGFWGGVIFSIISGIAYFYMIPQAMGLSLSFFIILGIVVSIFATFGDLVESMLKRSLGVKDSGNLIPGHGGILDRIDSLLFVLPASVFYILIYIILSIQ